MTLVAHSIYVCINALAYVPLVNIANVLNQKKAAGCNYNNGVSSNPQSVAITDPDSGQVINVLFDFPDLLPVLVNVYYAPNASVADPQAAITQAILDYVAGQQNGNPGLQVGQNVSCFELAGAIITENPGLYIPNVEITLASNPSGFSNAEIPINAHQLATIVAGSITAIPT